MRFSSFLCVAIMMAVNTSASWLSSSASSFESIDHALVGRTTFDAIHSSLHSFQTLQTSGPTSYVFGDIPAVSANCKAANIILEQNTTATSAAVGKAGCTDLDKQTCSQTTKTCTCIQTFTNDAPFRAAAQQAGGQACSVSVIATAQTSAGPVGINYQGIAGLVPVASQCSDADLQALLNMVFDAAAAGFKKANTADFKFNSMQGQFNFCNTTVTGTRQISAAYHNTQYGVALIIAAIVTFITMQ